MSFRDCIDNAEREGKISKERAAALRDDYERTRAELDLAFGPHAEEEAARQVFDRAAFEARERRRRVLLQARAGERLAKRQDVFRQFDGKPGAAEFIVNLIQSVPGKLRDSSIDARRTALRGRAHAMMADAVQAFERDALGRTRNKAMLRDVVRAAFGETAPETAAMLAKGWMRAAEFLRTRFNAAGGHIGKLENWGLPQSHDAIAVGRAGYEAWREFILPRLDLARILDWRTGKPFSGEAFELALREAFETIRTEGLNKLEPSGAVNGVAMANRHADHRFLVFKNADAWIEYQDAFGQGDAFATMIGHLDMMARDVAAMEVMGPNPGATLRFLTQRAEKAEGDASKGKRVAAEQMWRLYTGAANDPQNPRAARALGGVRDYLVSAQLGTAVVSSFASDVFNAESARHYAGLPQARALGEAIKYMIPDEIAGVRRGEAQRDALVAGLVAQEASQIALQQARYVGELNAKGLTRWLADTTMRWSLLSPWTQGARWAHGMSFLAELGRVRDRSLADLQKRGGRDARLAASLKRHGLDGAWDEIRRTKLYEPRKGAGFLRPEDVAERTDIPPERADYLANRLLEMLHEETEMAIPTNNLRVRATARGDARPGSLTGEFILSTAMYRAYASTLPFLIANRAMEAAATRGQYQGWPAMAAAYVAGLTLVGGLTLQMRQLTDGLDPMAMDDERFWIAAFAQGGGVGILGDFAFAATNRYGGSLGQTLSGPVVGAANTAFELTAGNLGEAATGQDMHLGRDFVRAAKSLTPGGTLWYSKLAYRRLILDQMQLFLDPDAEKDFRRIERAREKDFGQGYWWAPGETAPERAPELATALGGGN